MQRMLEYAGGARRHVTHHGDRVTEQSSRHYDQYVKDRKPWRVFGTFMLQLSGLFNTETYTNKTKSTHALTERKLAACVLSSTATKILTKREITPPTRRKIHGHELISHIIFHLCVQMIGAGHNSAKTQIYFKNIWLPVIMCRAGSAPFCSYVNANVNKLESCCIFQMFKNNFALEQTCVLLSSTQSMLLFLIHCTVRRVSPHIELPNIVFQYFTEYYGSKPRSSREAWLP